MCAVGKNLRLLWESTYTFKGVYPYFNFMDGFYLILKFANKGNDVQAVVYTIITYIVLCVLRKILMHLTRFLCNFIFPLINFPP